MRPAVNAVPVAELLRRCSAAETAATATARRFRLPYGGDVVSEAIVAQYRAEVLRRRPELGSAVEVSDDVRRAASIAGLVLAGESERRGLLIIGRTGNGKTTLARAMARVVAAASVTENTNGRVRSYGMEMRSARDIAVLRTQDAEAFGLVMGTPLLAIDDLGVEPAEVKEWGNTWSPMVELLSYRYDRQLLTVITTNLTTGGERSELLERYGERTVDRLREMMAVVAIRGGSYRG